MSTTTTREACNIILPPGDVIQEITDIKPSGNIHITHKFDNTPPLVPHVRVKRERNEIFVEAIVFIDSTAENPKLQVSQLLSVNTVGKYQLQFFIHCDEQEIKRLRRHKTGISYKAYTTSFSTKSSSIPFPEGVTLDHIELIQTFLWNIDPETSRGTESVVQTTD